MFERLRDLVSSIGKRQSSVDRFAEDDHRLAAAVLMVHANRVDGRETNAEIERLTIVLRRRFALDADEAKALVTAASRRDKTDYDLLRLAAILRRAYGPEDRQRLLAMMWEIVFADGIVHDFEDAMVWRVAGLLDISEADGDVIRRTVAGQLGLVQG